MYIKMLANYVCVRKLCTYNTSYIAKLVIINNQPATDHELQNNDKLYRYIVRDSQPRLCPAGLLKQHSTLPWVIFIRTKCLIIGRLSKIFHEL